MHIVLNVTYTLHPGAREAFLAALQQNQLLEQVRGEAGCLQYELFAAVESPDRLVLLEHWDSQAHLDAHMAGAPFQAIHQVEQAHVAQVDVRRFGVSAGEKG